MTLQNQRMCALHPNIVQLREVFLTADYLAVAMEYADGGDLSEHIDQQYQKGVSCADSGSVLESQEPRPRPAVQAPQSLDVLLRAATRADDLGSCVHGATLGPAAAAFVLSPGH